MGRWLSPDWSATPEPVPYAKLDNPQSLNLYGYVLNNPVTNRDRDGHVCIFGFGGTCASKAPVPKLSLPKPPALVNYNGHEVSDPKVRDALSNISRFFASSTVNVTSGDRESRPKGSPPRSEHLFHDAADFHVQGMSDHEAKESLKAAHSPVFNGFDVIQHGPYTATEGPHVHLDAGEGQGKDQTSRSTFKHEGMTPDGTNHYTPEAVQQ